MKFCKIQDGRRPPIEIYKYGNNVETAWPEWAKIWQESSPLDPQYENFIKSFNFEIPDGHHFEKH